MSAKRVMMEIWECVCERCGHRWKTKTSDLPKVCADCTSPYWNTPRKDISK
jgi:hypothetical protein